MRVGGATLGARTQIGSVAKHLGQGHLGPDDLAAAPLLHPFDPASPGGEVADDVAHVVVGGDDLDGHDRLEQHRLGPGRLLEAHGPGDLERHLRGVDVVVGPVGEGGADVDHRVAGQHAGLHGVLDAGVDRGDVLLRNHAAGDLVDELVAAPRAGGLEVDDDVAVLAPTAGLADVALLDLLAGLRMVSR